MKKPKIVTFDLETIWDINEWAQEDRAFGMSAWEGRTLKADINSILCFGYQIHGQKAHVASVWDCKGRFKKNLNDDFYVCSIAYSILKDADAIVTHNGKRFDWKFLQTRLKKHGFPTLPKIQHIDTCAVAKANFSLFSNRLKDLAVFLKVAPKVSTQGRQLWTRIYRGDKTAYKEMHAYCKQDVETTTACALKLQDVIANWPNINIFNDSMDNCPTCGGKHLQKNGFIITRTKKLQRYRCVDCGSSSSQSAKGVLK